MTTVMPHNEARESALGPPRFTLRTLWLAVTGLCCLFAFMAAIGMVWSLALAFVLSLVAAHVLGNSLGTKLRDGASQRGDDEMRTRSSAAFVHPVAAPTRLTQRASLHKVTFVMSLGGATAGAFLGGTGFARLYPEATPAALSLGIISAAVLGGFAGFATSSFLSVARGAMREALGRGEATIRPPSPPLAR